MIELEIIQRMIILINKSRFLQTISNLKNSLAINFALFILT